MRVPVKLHASLQATASWQAQSRNLRVYVQIEVSERGESLSRISRANEIYKLTKNNKQLKRWVK